MKTAARISHICAALLRILKSALIWDIRAAVSWIFKSAALISHIRVAVLWMHGNCGANISYSRHTFENSWHYNSNSDSPSVSEAEAVISQLSHIQSFTPTLSPFRLSNAFFVTSLGLSMTSLTFVTLFCSILPFEHSYWIEVFYGTLSLSILPISSTILA